MPGNGMYMQFVTGKGAKKWVGIGKFRLTIALSSYEFKLCVSIVNVINRVFRMQEKFYFIDSFVGKLYFTNFEATILQVKTPSKVD